MEFERRFCGHAQTRLTTEGVVCLLLLLITFAVYYPALNAGIVSDDFSLVNRITWSDAARFWWNTWGFGRNEYRPITALMLALDNRLWGDEAWGYHLTNILLHFTTASLLFLWLWRLLDDRGVAVLAAVFFIAHPLHDERVTWISARDGMVSAAFMVFTLYAYVRWRQSGPNGPYRMLAVLSFAFSLLSYEGAAIVPLLLGAMELLFFPEPGTLVGRVRTVLRRLIPFGVTLAGYLLIWAALFQGAVGGYDLALDARSVLHNFSRLLYRLVYGHQRIAGALYILLLILSFRVWRQKCTTMVLAGATVLVCYLPFAPIRGFTPRFAYASCLGFSLLLGALLAASVREAGSWRRFVASLLVMVCLLGYYIFEVRRRVSAWCEAGDIARSISSQLKQLYPSFPQGAVLNFDGIPRMHGEAMVFPLGVHQAVEREYEGMSLRVESGIHRREPPPDSGNAEGVSARYYFEYLPDERRLVEVSARRQ